MTKQVQALLNQLRDKSYKAARTMTEEFPVIYPIDFFGFHLGKNEPMRSGVGNITPNYKRVITLGFDAVRRELVHSLEVTDSDVKKRYGQQMLDQLDNCIAVSDRYREAVKVSGNMRLYEALTKIPHAGAETFYEACVFLSLCIYFLRVSGAYHLGLGRFDQYMYSFYKHDLKSGKSTEELFETLEAFFISLNFDTDLYLGVQKGDNGQSMALGGFDVQGNSVYNELSDLCLRASSELELIDPKINLRVGKNTPLEVYVKGTELTKKGLGFPQYCNDDVVVPGLVKLGYDLEDAVDYTVAACWEFIIPGCGADIPNIAAVNFPLTVNETLHDKLRDCQSFEQLMEYVEENVAKASDNVVENIKTVPDEQPLLSVFMDGCIETLTDLWHGGAKYFNYGCFGVGISNAADALAAVKRCVFDEKGVTPDELLDALDKNFEGCSELRNRLRACPKMGNNEPYVDDISVSLMTVFSKNINNRSNGYHGIWRAGTGSAQEYIRGALQCPATADGRKAFEPYASSFSPSLDVKTTGLLSTIQSFTKYDMTEIVNGGPLTLEIHDTVLRNEIGIEKTAQLVKLFIELGGHQLQLNSINRERLVDAQKHPEKYPNLIVRVWGWSGYFNELDLPYQNHIIRRCEYTG